MRLLYSIRCRALGAKQLRFNTAQNKRWTIFVASTFVKKLVRFVKPMVREAEHLGGVPRAIQCVSHVKKTDSS